MKAKWPYLGLLFIFVLYASFPSFPFTQNKQQEFPEFEFEVWGSVPSRRVHTLKGERIAEEEHLVSERLEEMEKHGLVKKKENKWILNFPFFLEKRSGKPKNWD